jgi:hypothetical protein
MGWASAGGIFDPVARELIASGADDDTRRKVCSILIGVLQGGDWDTERESLHEFADDPAIVQAFGENWVFLSVCHAEHPDVRWRYCRREAGHEPGHDDNRGNTWPGAGCDG